YRALYPLSDNDYYAVPAWNGASMSGYIEIEKACAAFKKYRFQREISLKYQIEMPYDYFEKMWERDYAGVWKTWSTREKLDRQSDFFKSLNEHLTGSDNVMKTFFSFFGYDPHSMKEIPGIRIKPIDGESKGGDYLDDIDQVNTQISYAAG